MLNKFFDGFFFLLVLVSMLICGAILNATYKKYMTTADLICFEPDKIEQVFTDTETEYTLYKVWEDYRDD